MTRPWKHGWRKEVGTRAAAPLLVLSTLFSCKAKPDVEKPKVHVAAASDLAFAFKDLGAAYEKDTGTSVVFTFGSTGLLAKQIAGGAPFEVFAAANASFVDDAVKSGACFGDTKRSYALGRLVIWGKKGSSVPATLDRLKDPEFRKIAIANPAHAPYGRAAKEALMKAGAWNALEKRMVYGENVQQALQFAQTGNAEVALVALSLAVVSDGDYALVDASLHEPLDQTLAVCNGGRRGSGKPPSAEAFVSFVGSEKGRAIMRRYGFLLPGESPLPR